MFNEFKNGENVIVNGHGKCNDKHYRNVKGTVISRDPYYLDYNIKFDDGTEDWIDGIYLKKLKGEKRR